MTTTAKNGPAPHNRLADVSGADLMEAVLAQPINARTKQMGDVLEKPEWIAKVEALLPPNMKGQASRLIKRAVLTMSRKGNEYEKVEPLSFYRCILEAAELGLAIDGKLAHAVVFNNKVKKDGRDSWVSQTQLMVDYKGLIAIARRTGTIKDCVARLVCGNDEFSYVEHNGKADLSHKIALGERGSLIGAYAIVIFPDDSIRVEWMSTAEIDAVRGRSKSWKGGQGFGPWKTDDGEMRKKTVSRRALKTLIDDPAFERAQEIDDRDYSDYAEPVAVDRILGQVSPSKAMANRILGEPTPATASAPEDNPSEEEWNQSPDDMPPDEAETAPVVATKKPVISPAQEATAADFTQDLGEAAGDKAALMEIGKRIGGARDKLGSLYDQVRDAHTEAMRHAK